MTLDELFHELNQCRAFMQGREERARELVSAYSSELEEKLFHATEYIKQLGEELAVTTEGRDKALQALADQGNAATNPVATTDTTEPTPQE